MNWMETVNKVVEEKQFACVDPITGQPVKSPRDVCEQMENDQEPLRTDKGNGVILDLFTASIMQQVYECLTDKNKSKFKQLPFIKAHRIAMSAISK